MESYQKAAEFPGSDVFINSTVAGMGRSCPQERKKCSFYAVYPVPIGGGLLQVYYGGPTVLPEEQAKVDIVASTQRFQEANGLRVTDPDWAKFSGHSPFNLTVSNDAAESGFYERLFSLKGQRNAFYNGAVWYT